MANTTSTTTTTNSRISSSKPLGSKYVPPHLRNSQRSGGNNNNNNSQEPQQQRSSFSSSQGRGGGNSGYSGRSSGSNYNSSGRGGSYNNTSSSNRGAYTPSTNSRWSNTGGGAGSHRSSYSRVGPRKNERGFHGDMNPDKRLEQRLFDTTDKQTTGINFDNYDKIPIDVSGENVPEPISEYTMETIGEDLFRNSQLCGYTKPTPVQKYSIPICTLGRDLMGKCSKRVKIKHRAESYLTFFFFSNFRSLCSNRKWKDSWISIPNHYDYDPQWRT